MTDYFVYNGKSVAPSYFPGVHSYGQEGSRGNTGSVGPSVYYTSYDLSVKENVLSCCNLIKYNKVLSNNIDDISLNLDTNKYTFESYKKEVLDKIEDSVREYIDGDLILDSTGEWYRIKKGSEIELVRLATKTVVSTENIFKSFKVSIGTSYMKSSKYTWKIDNPNYQSTDDNNSDENDNVLNTKKIYHSNIYREYIYGNWIKFHITTDAVNNFSYTFNLVLPSGQVLPVVSEYPYAIMFVDNRFFYGYKDVASFTINENELSALELNTYKKLIENLPPELKENNTSNSIQNLLGGSIDNKTYLDLIALEDKCADLLTLMFSYFIRKYCTAYAEIKNEKTGKVLRFDLKTDIYLDSAGNVIDEDSEGISDINPYDFEINWQIADSSVYNINEKIASISEDTNEIIRGFGNFLVFKDSKEDSNTENGYKQSFYYIDKLGFTPPTLNSEQEAGKDDLIYYSEHGWKKYTDNLEDYSEYSHTLLLKFKGLSSFSLNIKFIPFKNEENDSVLPSSIIYIGFPNMLLYQNVSTLEEQELDPTVFSKQLEEGETEFTEGYFYLHKFIPYGKEYDNETDAIIADAGLAIINIDLKKFGLDPNESNFIEIGVMPIGNFSNSEHRSIIYNKNSNEGIDENDIRLSIANTSNYSVYNFASNDVSTSGLPDVEMYISDALPLMEDELNNIDTIGNISNESEEIETSTSDSSDEESSEEPEVIEESTKLARKYVELGLLWDDLTYFKKN